MITRKDEREPEICIICAWRQDCKKKFSLAHGQKCLEFTRDLTLKGKVVPEEPPKDQ